MVGGGGPWRGGTVAAVTRLGAAKKKSRTVALERRVDPTQPTRNENCTKQRQKDAVRRVLMLEGHRCEGDGINRRTPDEMLFWAEFTERSRGGRTSHRIGASKTPKRWLGDQTGADGRHVTAV